MKELMWFDSVENTGNALLKFHNCQLLCGSEFVDQDLWIFNGKVIDPVEVFFERLEPDYKINCEQLFLAPGFIDLQVNGALGIDISNDCSNPSRQLDTLASQLPRYGITAFCPTLVSSSGQFYLKALQEYKKREGGEHGAAVLGLHLEGPFISQHKKGAHPEENIVNGFDNGFKTLTEVYGSDLSQVAYITLAPELRNAMTVIRELTTMGIRVSLGHSAASFEIGELALRHGATGLTHLLNAMNPFHHRDPCLPGLLSCTQRPLHFGIIADLVHSRGEVLNFFYRVRPEGMMLVTDSVPAMGLPNGSHHLGNICYEVTGSKATVQNSCTLAGGMTPMNICIKNLISKTECPAEDALMCASWNPASFLGLQNCKGKLIKNYDADFVILDKMMNVKATFVGGHRVFVCNK